MSQAIQIDTLQIKRGLKADLPILAQGEMGFCTDTKEVYIGDGISNVPLSSDTFYTHNQIAASSKWTITHNLNRFPSVTVVDSAGSVVVGEVNYISSNIIDITFQGAFSGKAYLNY